MDHIISMYLNKNYKNNQSVSSDKKYPCLNCQYGKKTELNKYIRIPDLSNPILGGETLYSHPQNYGISNYGIMGIIMVVLLIITIIGKMFLFTTRN